MSVSGIIDPTTNKIYPILITGNVSVAQTLGEVLSIGSSASNPTTGLPQDATDFKVLGCEEIETSLVYMGNQPFLKIGEAGDKLMINGAITKGSILVGNGLETKELVVGANGLVLKANSSQSYGVEWGVDGTGGITSVNSGNNINVNNTNPLAPTVNLLSPLNVNVDVGNIDIVSTTGAIDIIPYSGSDLNLNVGGSGKIHITQTGTGGDNQPAISVENNNGNANGVHLDLYKNSNSPAVNDTIGGISFHANSSTGVKREYASIEATLIDPTNTSENGSLSLSTCVNGSTPTEFFRCSGTNGYNQLYRNLDTQNNYITSTTTALTLLQSNNSGGITLNNTGINGTINITSIGGVGISASTIDGVKIGQTQNARTQLRTTIIPAILTQPVEFYPEVSIDNNNTNSLNIELPKVFYQKLNLINKGITPLVNWVDVGTAWGNVDCMYLASSGYVWLAIGSQIYITDTTFTTSYPFNGTYPIVTLTGGATIRVSCMYEGSSGYMYIGGIFDAVNNNATPQNGLARLYVGSGIGNYYEDPIYDSSQMIYGVYSGQEVLAISELMGTLMVGGSFLNFSNGTSANYGFQVQNVTSGGGSQSYNNNSNDFYFNGVVNTIYNNGNYVFWGGQFTTAQNNMVSIQYIGAWNGSWSTVGNNGFNSYVNCIKQSAVNSSYVLVGGSFNQNFTNICYVDGVTPNNPEVSAGFFAGTIDRNCLYNAVANSTDLVVTSSGDNYISSSFQVYTTLGQSNSGITPNGCFYNGTAFNSYNLYTYVRSTSSASQVVNFVGLSPTTFRYNSTEYQTFSLNTKWTAQSFVADSTGSYWYPLGGLSAGGSFS